jgi:hypothetical protein
MINAHEPDRPRHDEKALRDEHLKVQKLGRVADLISFLLTSPSVSIVQACQLIRLTKRFALNLFPEKENTFELIYRRRFSRILAERLSRSPEYLN